jgi:hypothetical protein
MNVICFATTNDQASARGYEKTFAIVRQRYPLPDYHIIETRGFGWTDTDWQSFWQRTIKRIGALVIWPRTEHLAILVGSQYPQHKRPMGHIEHMRHEARTEYRVGRGLYGMVQDCISAGIPVMAVTESIDSKYHGDNRDNGDWFMVRRAVQDSEVWQDWGYVVLEPYEQLEPVRSPGPSGPREALEPEGQGDGRHG